MSSSLTSSTPSISSIIAQSLEAQIDAQNAINDKFLEFLDSFANKGTTGNNELFFKTFVVDKGNTLTTIRIPYLSLANIPNFQVKTVETEVKVNQRANGSKVTSSQNSDYKIRFVSEKPAMSPGLAKLMELISETVEVSETPKQATV